MTIVPDKYCMRGQVYIVDDVIYYHPAYVEYVLAFLRERLKGHYSVRALVVYENSILIEVLRDYYYV